MKKNVEEADIESYLVRKAKPWLCLKFVSPGTVGVPDRILIGPGKVWFVELKRPGERPRPSQKVLHKKFKNLGHEVRVLDSKEAVDAFLEEVRHEAT